MLSSSIERISSPAIALASLGLDWNLVNLLVSVLKKIEAEISSLKKHIPELKNIEAPLEIREEQKPMMPMMEHEHILKKKEHISEIDRELERIKNKLRGL